jgi:hypothetical protein
LDFLQLWQLPYCPAKHDDFAVFAETFDNFNYQTNVFLRIINLIKSFFSRACCKPHWRFATGPEFCLPEGFQNTSLVCWQLKTEVLQLPLTNKYFINRRNAPSMQPFPDGFIKI